MNPSFGTYQLAEEHEALREAVRSLAEKEIKPFAAEVDDNERFPVEAHNALVVAESLGTLEPMDADYTETG